MATIFLFPKEPRRISLGFQRLMCFAPKLIAGYPRSLGRRSTVENELIEERFWRSLDAKIIIQRIRDSIKRQAVDGHNFGQLDF